MRRSAGLRWADPSPHPRGSSAGSLLACPPRLEVERSSLAQVRSSSSSKESIDETSPVVALRYAPTAAVRRARSARARGSGWASRFFLLPALRWMGIFPERKMLGHFGCGAKPWGYRGQQELRALLLQKRKIIAASGHALPALRGGRDHTQAAVGGDVEHRVGSEQADPPSKVRR